MEQESRRAKFIRTHFLRFYSEMVLTDQMISELDDDINNPYRESMPVLKVNNYKELWHFFTLTLPISNRV